MRFAILGGRGYPSFYGGFETLVRHLAPYLVESGHEVVVYGRAGSARTSQRTIDGVDVRLTPGLDFKSSSTLSFGLTASRDLMRHPCDAALVLNIANGFYLRLLRRAQIPACVNVDGLEWDRGKWGLLARKTFQSAAKATARDADALIFDSQALAAVWQDMFQRDGVFIPYGAPVLTGVGTEQLKARGLPTQGYVLVVARVVPENNVDLLLDAVSLLPEITPVVVVGDSNYDHATIARIRALAVAGRIAWLGHVDDQDLLDELWANAGVYWHGHSVGGTNPALLQALGAGAPTLALDTAFNREVIAHDRQLVPQDPSVLAVRLADVLESPDRADSFRNWGRAVVQDRYSWEAVCEKYCALLLQLARARPVSAKSRESVSAAAEATRDRRSEKSELAPTDRVRTRGRLVAVVGPDGAGKSQLTSQLQQGLTARLGRQVSVVNFRSRHVDRILRRRSDHDAALAASVRPHETPVRGRVAASAKALLLWTDIVLSAWRWRRSGQESITLVERYAYDFVVDPARLGLRRVPRRFRRVLLHLTPRPDVVLVCHAPVSVVHARKPELETGEIGRQYAVWAELQAAGNAPFISVDTTASVDTDQLASRVLSVLEP